MTAAEVGAWAETAADALGVGTGGTGALLTGAAGADVAGTSGAAGTGWGRVDGAIPAIGGGVGAVPPVGAGAEVGTGAVSGAGAAPRGASGVPGCSGGAVVELKANNSSEPCASASDCIRAISFAVKASLTAKMTISPLR